MQVKFIKPIFLTKQNGWTASTNWLDRFAEPAGVHIIATLSVYVLAVVIRDFHEHVLVSPTVAKRARREAVI